MAETTMPTWTDPVPYAEGQKGWTVSSLSYTGQHLDLEGTEARYDLIVGREPRTGQEAFLVHRFEDDVRQMTTHFESEAEARTWVEDNIRRIVEEDEQNSQFWERFNDNT